MAESVSPRQQARYSAALARALEIAGPRRPVRVIALLQPNHDPARLREALSAFQMVTGRRPAPGMIELEVRIADLDRLAEREDLFRYFDTPDRLYGQAVSEDAPEVAFRLRALDPERMRRAVEAAGGRVAGRSGQGEFIGTLPSARLGDLLLEDTLEAIEVTGVVAGRAQASA